MRPILLTLLPLLAASCQSTSTRPAGALDTGDMDRSVSPGDDFYRYANGGWLDRTEIPGEHASWSMGTEVRERNRDLLRELLEEAAADDAAPAGSARQKLGDFWSSGMDVERIEAERAAPLHATLQRIAKIASTKELARTLADLHAIGVPAVFGIGSEAGLRDPSRTMLWITQGGLGLPDRDYYTREGEEADALRAAYVQHVATMLALLGDSEQDAERGAGAVMAFETRLAQASLTNVALRDPQNYDRLVAREDMVASMPAFDWNGYLAELGLDDVQEVNQPMPDFFAEVDRMLAEVPLEDWRTYLRWHTVSSLAGALSSDFENESFRFYSTVLSGVPEMPERWKRVLDATNGALGELVGQLYVARAFPPEAKQRVEAMVDDLLAVMGQRIEKLEWMGPATKEQALAKLATFRTKLGYPDEWRDWSKLEIGDGSYAQNVMRANAHEQAWQLSKVGKPVDPNEWGMTPQTLNAYYHPLRNEIVFPAAILQPPFFGEDVDDPLNYGAIGAVIGHEITHGFDDSGSQFDAQGRLRNWWTDEDRAEFESRTRKVVEQYDAYEALPGLFVNGQLTLGENIADLGGVSVAFEAMQRANAGVPDPMLDGLSREQRFFVAFARVWRAKMRDEALRLMVNTNVHSPARFRAIGPLANLQSFADAFDVPADAPMMLPPAARADIW